MQSIRNKMKNTNQEAIIEFKPKLPKLSKNEKEVLKLLVEAARLIAPIFIDQEKGAKVAIDKEEIEKLGKKDPIFLSPFTVVEKVEERFVATPYHIKYQNLLKPIAEKLEQASKISDNKEFAKCLKIQSQALLDGSNEKATACWIKAKPYILDISIGPLSYFNRLFEGKAVYQAWVGVLDIEGTKRLNNYKTIVFNASRRALVPYERLENSHNVKAKTIDEVILSGLMARSKFVGLNLPMEIEWVEKYGSEVTIFNQVNKLRIKEQIMPTFEKFFTPAFKEEFTKEDLSRASLRYVALHELAHNYLYYKHSSQNLQDLFPVIYELTATLLGMRIAGSLLLIDRLTNKQLESMIIAFVCRSYDLIEKSKKNKLMSNYAQGGAIFINYMLKNEAIKQKGKLAIPNFTKIFLSLHELSYIMERLLASGTKKDAESFINKSK